MGDDEDDYLADSDLIHRRYQPVFPPADRLIPLAPASDTAPLLTAETYNKETLKPNQRKIDGWITSADRGKNSEDKGTNLRLEVISDILARWWFVLPMWPPVNHDYAKVLESQGYREVAIKDWLTSKERDDHGLYKVYQLTNFEGVFRNSAGKMLDMRPKKSCPCYANLNQLPMVKLIDIVIRALENQILVLKEVKGAPMGHGVERAYKQSLELLLDKWRKSKSTISTIWTSASQKQVEKDGRKM